MLIRTDAFVEGEAIPVRYAEQAADGENVHPALAWSEAPEGTRSFALTLFDPDAPTGSGFWHWIAFDIPASTTEIGEGENLPVGAREWMNDYGYEGYGGPCPPEGRVHRYIHTVHALSCAKLEVPEGATQAQVRFAIFAHQLDSVSVTGRFQFTAKGN